jgi:anti-sigma regulatory factor (Ser/Thr protein kinase)
LEELAQSWTLPASTVFAIQLCCEEGFSNIVRHGRDVVPDQGLEGGVRIELARADSTVELVLEDQGAPFDPVSLPPAALPDGQQETRVGGLGVHLMRNFSEQMLYRRRGEVNSLLLRFATAS